MVLLLSCVSLVLADFQGAYESKRVRTGRQQREDGPSSRPQRRLRPLQKKPAGKALYYENMGCRVFKRGAKLYIPSTLNIALLQWHTHLNVCAVK